MMNKQHPNGIVMFHRQDYALWEQKVELPYYSHSELPYHSDVYACIQQRKYKWEFVTFKLTLFMIITMKIKTYVVI